MSWQAYVDSSLVGTGHVDKAAIFSVDGTSCWATSAGFQIAPAEMQAIVGMLKPGGGTSAFANGIRVAGAKYVTLKAEDRSLYGKQGKEGVVIVKTTQAILLSHYPESVQPNQAVTTVEGLADYLIGQGY